MDRKDIFCGLSEDEWRGRMAQHRTPFDYEPANPLDDPIVIKAVNETIAELQALGKIVTDQTQTQDGLEPRQ